jgi:hypothetical protein
MIGSPTNCLIIWIKYTCTQDLSPPITTWLINYFVMAH